ncbi:MAG TPA: GNAT family N-acetyltransferase [Nitrososphaerales archaeon]|nr:GNAT family N-acetyltransferase [Nitrososphaerales archaeon]
MDEETFEVGAADPRGPEAAELIRLLSAELAQRYDYAEDGSGGFKPEDALGPRGAFVIGRVGGNPVACGAIRPLEKDVAELKRVFVKVGFRGRGYSKAIVNDLERQARERGYRVVRLETGVRQPEAISLYERLGYHRIPNYGEYRDSGLSVCFEKRLA